MSTSPATASLEVGTIIANTYEIVRILGRGGMGSVWEANHVRLPGKRVAVKVLHASIAGDPDSLARFRREAEIACRLGHPNIVEVHDFNNLEDGSPYLILEMLEGRTLDERLRAEGRLDLEACEHILRQVGSALQCAHEQGVVHRDLKPQNIFLVPSPAGLGPEVAKLLDFGISKIRGSQTVKTQDTTLLGTPQYMAPEQAMGNHDEVDARTDLFALASMLYELLCGKPAFGGQSIPEVVYKVVHGEVEALGTLVPDLPEDKAAAIHKALSKKRDERFPDIASFVEAFTGTVLPPTRRARESQVNELGGAATVDSSKMDIAVANTFESHSTQMPSVQAPADIAISETLDSAKVKASVATTMEPSHSQRIEASVQLEGVEDAKIQSIEVKAGTHSGLKSYVISMVVVCGAAVGAFALFARGEDDQKQRQSTSSEISANSADPEPSLPEPPPPPEIVSRETGTNSDPAVGAESQTSAMDAGSETQVAESRPSQTNAPKPPVIAESDPGASLRAQKQRREQASDREAVEASKTTTKRTANQTTGESETEEDPPLKGELQALLDKAAEDLAAGRINEAIFKAKRANRIRKTTRSFAIQAMAYCKDKDLSSVRAAMRSIPRRQYPRIKRYCERVNFPLND